MATKRSKQGEFDGMPEAHSFQGTPVEERVIAITGASALKVAEPLTIGDRVEVTGSGVVVAVTHQRKTRARRDGGAHYMRARTTIKLDEATKVETFGPAEDSGSDEE